MGDDLPLVVPVSILHVLSNIFLTHALSGSFHVLTEFISMVIYLFYFIFSKKKNRNIGLRLYFFFCILDNINHVSVLGAPA